MGILLYVDGSSSPKTSSNKVAVGYGCVVYSDKGHSEHRGAYLTDRSLCGAHELIALMEGILVARDLGYDYHDVSVYTDDDRLPHMPNAMNDGNYALKRMREAVMSLVEEVCLLLYTPAIKDECVKFFREARFTKLKGHSTFVCHNRADYLARNTMRNFLADIKGEKPRPILEYDEWLQDGFRYFNASGEELRWFAPFTANAGAPGLQISV